MEIAPWKELSSADEVKTLMKSYGYLHDGCIREIHIVTSESVQEDMSMTFDDELVATILLQMQWRDPSPAIELRFVRVHHLNFIGPGKDHGNLIYEATFSKIDGLFYWADDGAWDLGDDSCVWISAERVFWRARPDLTGPVNRLKEKVAKEEFKPTEVKLRKITELDNDFEFWRGQRFRLLNDGKNIHSGDSHFDYILTSSPWERDYMMLVNITENSHKAGSVYVAKIAVDNSSSKFIVTRSEMLKALGKDAKNFYLL